MRKKKAYVSPSILAADFTKLGEEIKRIESDSDFIHVDVMDGHFVPNISIGVPVVRSLNNFTDIPLDVHLMIDNPEKYIKAFSDVGADYITFHYEVTDNPNEVINLIRKCGKKPGISLNPNTAVEKIYPYLNEVDLVLVMSVFPGFGGQKFITDSVGRINKIRKELDRISSDAILSVDGGIGIDNAKDVFDAGVEMVVAGSSIFKSDNPRKALLEIKKCAE